jgi:hypothetical protein
MKRTPDTQATIPEHFVKDGLGGLQCAMCYLKKFPEKKLLVDCQICVP